MARVRVAVPSGARRPAEPGEPPGDGFVLEGDAYKHVVRVLRLGEGDEVLLADGSGSEFACRLGAVGRRSAWARIEEEHVLCTEAGVELTLCCGLLKGDKLDLVLQKGTELGVRRFVLFESRRSVRRVDGGGQARGDSPQLRRWQRIVEAAAAQSGRAVVPEVIGPLTWDACLVEAAHAEARLLLYEGPVPQRLGDSLRALGELRSVALLVGPEGGFDPAEVTSATEQGFVAVTLGPRILRAETAALVVPALVLQVLGQLG